MSNVEMRPHFVISQGVRPRSTQGVDPGVGAQPKGSVEVLLQPPWGDAAMGGNLAHVVARLARSIIPIGDAVQLAGHNIPRPCPPLDPDAWTPCGFTDFRRIAKVCSGAALSDEGTNSTTLGTGGFHAGAASVRRVAGKVSWTLCVPGAQTDGSEERRECRSCEIRASGNSPLLQGSAASGQGGTESGSGTAEWEFLNLLCVDKLVQVCYQFSAHS
jgi:hypothetical protein